MVSILRIQILSIIATALTNLVGILTFATDYWSVVVYDLVKIRSYAKWIMIDETNNDSIYIINNTNEIQTITDKISKLSTIVIGMDNHILLFSTHKGIFRQCNYLSNHTRSHLNIPKCRAIKTSNYQDDYRIHGMINPAREFIRKYFLRCSSYFLFLIIIINDEINIVAFQSTTENITTELNS